MPPPLILPRQDSAQYDSDPGLNPSLIVGICIIGAIFVCVMLASVLKLCQSLPSRTSYKAEVPLEDLFRPYSQDQVEHMREVRWWNHSEMWEAAKFARMEMGEQFGTKPKFNRRTGVGWGFVVQKDGYMRKAAGGDGEDAWSSQGTSGESRKSIVNDRANRHPRPESYYGDCNPHQRAQQQHNLVPGSHYQQTYEALNRSDDKALDAGVIEPFPDLPRIPGIEQRFQQQRQQGAVSGGHVRMVRNDEVEQASFADESAGTGMALRKPQITLNDGSHDIGRGGGYGGGDCYGTGQAIEMRDLTGMPPHAR